MEGEKEELAGSREKDHRHARERPGEKEGLAGAAEEHGRLLWCSLAVNVTVTFLTFRSVLPVGSFEWHTVLMPLVVVRVS